MDPRRVSRRRMIGVLFGAALAGAVLVERQNLAEAAGPAGADPGRLHWLAVADTGGGNEAQRAVGRAMAAVHRARPVDLVLLGGDNIYPKGDIGQVKDMFTIPYKALLEAGVPFHAVLGNHDIRTANGDPQIAYKPFGMKGRWYTLPRGPVEFFMLDSNVNADWGRQLPWLKRALASSKAPWKVVVAHHPIHSSGHYGDDVVARNRLAPLFRQFGVQLYINGHEHNYERSKPINGTTYLVVGGGGAHLRKVTPGTNSARAISVHSFAELTASKNQLLIQAWDSKGQAIDRAAINPAGQLIKP